MGPVFAAETGNSAVRVIELLVRVPFGCWLPAYK